MKTTASIPVMLPNLKCKRCGHEWTPRKPMISERCGKCRSPYWHKARKRKAVEAGAA